MDVRDQQNQNTQQNHDFDEIKEEELDTAPEPVVRIQSKGFEQAANQVIQPLHTKDFVLKKVPYRF